MVLDEGSEHKVDPCADPERFAQVDPALLFFFFFFLDEGKEDPYSTKSGPSSASQRNAIQMAQH